MLLDVDTGLLGGDAIFLVLVTIYAAIAFAIIVISNTTSTGLEKNPLFKKLLEYSEKL